MAELKADAKVTLDIAQDGGGGTGVVLKLKSVVEEITDDGGLLVQMPQHRGAVFPLTGDMDVTLRFIADSVMYALPVRYTARVARGGLLYAKLLRTGEPTHEQQRECFRVCCAIPVTASLVGRGGAEPVYGRTVDFGEGGMKFASDVELKKDELVGLRFNAGQTETVIGKTLRTERAERGAFRYNAAILFQTDDAAQRQRFYRFIVEWQMEERRKKLFS